MAAPAAAQQTGDSGGSSQSSSTAPQSSAPSAQHTVPQHSSTKKKVTHTTAKRKRRASPRVRRMHAAFVASANLKPMALQLLQDRTPAAYAGVEAYAQRHAKEDAGALAWLVVGYARTLDHDYAKSIEALNRAKPRAGDLGDYVAYYLGSAYLQVGRNAEAVSALADFETKYPESLLARDARVVYAASLVADGRGQEAVAILEKDRSPARADLELALGRAYAATGDTAKAGAAFRNVYYAMPTSPEADSAGAELKKLSGLSLVSMADRKGRAELLMKGKRYSDAVNEYRELQSDASPADRPGLQVGMAAALQKDGRNKDAKQVLNSIPENVPEDVNAQRLFLLGEVYRATDERDGFLHAQDELRRVLPTSPWLEQSLLATGNMYLLKKDYDSAIDAYRELQQRFPSGNRAAYAHWKVAWLSLRQGRNAEAAQEFEQQIALYPTSNEVPAALYWRGRLAEESGETGKARAYYQKISERFRNYYYAELARQRLKGLPEGEAESIALLDRVPPLPVGTKIDSVDPPEDDFRLQKAQLLENGGLVDLASRELQGGANSGEGNWMTAEQARLYRDCGRYDRAIQIMKRAVPNYFAVDVPELPRPYWEALFPKPYWGDLKRYSTQQGLDPYLVASLIRQESEFNPAAVSRANAVGLMQLLPVTGKKAARDLKLRHFSTNQLFTPGVNMQLGTYYFKTMVDKFGSFEYALAAYNAGADRVEDWLSAGKYRDASEFVESIPFTETREYVQAILRNANVYKQLYGMP